MPKVICKGMLFQQDIATVMTTVAQATTISLDGSEDITVDSTDLSGGPFKEYTNSGYAEPGTVTVELFYDPALSGHQTLTDLVGSGAGDSFRISYPTSGSATTQSITTAGQGFSMTGTVGELIRGTFTGQLTGSPGWAT